MTDLLERAIERVRALPAEMQDEIAGVVLQLLGDEGPPYQLTPDEEADLAAAEAEIERGELATEAEIQVVFMKYRR